MLFFSERAALVQVPPTAMAGLLDRAARARSDFAIPLVRGALEDRIDVLVFPQPQAPWAARHLRNCQRPTICWICDDPGQPTGCGGADQWVCANELGRWSRAAIIHAAGGEASHYAEAVRAAGIARRVAFIETASANAAGWITALRCQAKLLIWPHENVHPIAETVH